MPGLTAVTMAEKAAGAVLSQGWPRLPHPTDRPRCGDPHSCSKLWWGDGENGKSSLWAEKGALSAFLMYGISRAAGNEIFFPVLFVTLKVCLTSLKVSAELEHVFDVSIPRLVSSDPRTSLGCNLKNPGKCASLNLAHF